MFVSSSFVTCKGGGGGGGALYLWGRRFLSLVVGLECEEFGFGRAFGGSDGGGGGGGNPVVSPTQPNRSSPSILRLLCPFCSTLRRSLTSRHPQYPSSPSAQVHRDRDHTASFHPFPDSSPEPSDQPLIRTRTLREVNPVPSTGKSSGGPQSTGLSCISVTAQKYRIFLYFMFYLRNASYP